MLRQNNLFNKVVGVTLIASAFFAGQTQASPIVGGIVTPTITSGALPDSPAAHVDANTPNSPFSGVVSINIRYDGQSFICSGALVGKRSVVSAGHCVDTDGNGHIIDINKPGNDVRVVFNSNGNVNALITASAVSMNSKYEGFGKCPAGVNSFCVNDDISVITLSTDAPASAKIYRVSSNPVTSGTHIVMAGYGTSGDGINGYTVSPSFTKKRSGENYVDLFDGDDEQGFGGANEVYYADFDGVDANGVLQDTFCKQYGVCSPILPNNKESGIGGGDSGGPSFVIDPNTGEYILVANNTFSGNFQGQVKGSFGTYFGGILLASYTDYLVAATGGAIQIVPEPGSIAILGLGLGMLLMIRRRSKV
ncbi:trypsin-like serine protease [Undibacterium sp. RuTC16W]|uniref:trypsin-like serine protease n=1 Tax=Undibacterium sp. RuTC16W TaxID=3413048 RepID=UPI003BF36B85